MKRTAYMTIFIIALTGNAFATEFWDIYAEKIVYNYAIKAGMVPEEGVSQRLSSHEVLSISSKTFSQTFGRRFSEVAKSRSFLLFVCAFSREAEKCYLDNVMDTTFNEIKFLKQPKFSQKFIKKFSKFYTSTLANPGSLRGKKLRAEDVPRWKVFNPRFGFTLNDFEIIVASPFYTYYGIYVEPRWGTMHGPSLSILKGRTALDFDREGAAITYHMPGTFKFVDGLRITVRPEGEVHIENIIVFW